jgi:ATP-binding cassette subfamily B protein RaxB
MLSGFRHLPLVRQAEVTECGHACLAMIAAWFGHHVDLVSLRLHHPTSGQGLSAHALITLAGQYRLKGRALRLEPADLGELQLPAVLHWDMDHFVVLKSVGRNFLVIHDPARGVLRLTAENVAAHFTGIAIEFSKAEGFKPVRRERRLPLASVLGDVSAMVPQAVQIIALSVFFEALLLISPWYMQIAIDNVVPSDDLRLLVWLAGGFAVVALFRLVTEVMRAMVLSYVQAALDLSMSARLFVHMLRLPLPFFLKRDDGDLLSRFHSLDPIRQLLAEGLLLALIDGVLALMTLALMLVISPLLALVSLAALALYTGLRIGFYNHLFRLGENVVRADAQTTAALLESIRSVQTIKLFNAEDMRESLFIGRAAEGAHSRSQQQRMIAIFVALRETVLMLEQVGFVAVAAWLIMSGKLTIGVLYAILAYKGQFLSAGIHIVEKGVALRMLRLHLDRVSDIAATEQEKAYARPASDRAAVEGRIELSRVSFRYSPDEPFVVKELSATIEPGECIAITGPSGCGKTTVVKIMVGLLEPTDGAVLIDGIMLPVWGERAYRSQVATVMQDDHLLTGSIMQNICFFEEFPDHARIAEAAKHACIHDDIGRMPMGYRTVVGSLGTTLSAGQRQRVLLARALYRQPRLLFIDEGTANLDVDLERRINEMLSKLPITRIHVAHRPQTIALTDRVIHLGPPAEPLPSRQALAS